MGVTVVTPGRLVRVHPDKVDERDVLELAEALIAEHGHKKGESGDVSQGFSIHGAVGEAANRITGGGGKDAPDPRALRDKAARLLADTHGGQSENALNDDPAVGQAEAIQIIRDAREAVTQ